jgi:hypothetical protein
LVQVEPASLVGVIQALGLVMRNPSRTSIAPLILVILVLATLAWSVLDASEDTGIRATGNVLDCVNGRSRQCVVAVLPSNEQVWVFVPGGKKGDVVLLKQMKRPITKTVSYVISI